MLIVQRRLKRFARDILDQSDEIYLIDITLSENICWEYRTQ